MSDLVAAVEGFLESLASRVGAPPRAAPSGYLSGALGDYRLLYRDGQGGTEVILLADKEGAVYLAEALGPERQAAEACLRRRGFRPAGSTLVLRLPAEYGGQVAPFILWASPRYLASRGPEAALWK